MMVLEFRNLPASNHMDVYIVFYGSFFGVCKCS